MSILLKSIGFKEVADKQWELSGIDNKTNNLSRLFIAPKHDGDVFLPGNENSRFNRILIEETKYPGIYDLTFQNGPDDKVGFEGADIKDIEIVIQSLINECYQEKGYETPYSFNHLYPDIAVYSPFHGIDGRDDDFLISHENGEIRILKNPSETYPNYDLEKNNLDYNLEGLFDKFVTEETNKKHSNISYGI